RQQREVLHVPGADLQHIGNIGQGRDVRRLQHLTHQWQSGLAFRLAQDHDPVTAQALETVWRRARLEDAAPEGVAARCANLPAGLEKQLFPIDRAGPGDDPRPVTANLVRADRDPSVARAELAVRKLEWLRDGYHLGNARGLDKEIPQGEWIRSDDTDHASLVAVAQVGPST